ncbi:Serine/arginine-rich splicing factor SC35 [Zea mays]|uniref:Serine/arginine-rich splicing factor SC35 n=1 Tax=Zea mays TaxID=4577 RepID=A0A317Y738_MAIZE|nr:Serine/arginine-rich splicing factor SC35 [Zea mays]
MAMSRFGRSGQPENRESFSLLVLNVSFRTTADDLFPLFDRYGKVLDIYIPRDHRTGDPRGFAFVRYNYEDEARDAIDGLDGMRFDGRALMVQFAKYGPNAEKMWLAAATAAAAVVLLNMLEVNCAEVGDVEHLDADHRGLRDHTELLGRSVIKSELLVSSDVHRDVDAVQLEAIVVYKQVLRGCLETPPHWQAHAGRLGREQQRWSSVAALLLMMACRPVGLMVIGVELQKKIQSQGVVAEAAVQDRVLAICEGIERIIGIETIEGEARAEVGSDMNRPGTEMVIIVAIGLTVSVLIMTGNVTDTVALLYLNAPVIAEVVRLVGHLMKEYLASPEMAALHVLEALDPELWLNITQFLLDSLRHLNSSHHLYFLTKMAFVLVQDE